MFRVALNTEDVKPQELNVIEVIVSRYLLVKLIFKCIGVYLYKSLLLTIRENFG